ncbi:MAG: hypothetical protein IT304_02765 [Dehalococcoidia bacterium]|nr:hypothetical protein [Dehalococcoidia bacterium]
MVRLVAEENRYLLQSTPEEAALVQRIPGCRWLAQRRCWTFPHQAGVILALDRIFGERGWDHDAALAIDVASARGQVWPPAGSQAGVRLVRDQLAISCAVTDRELVKRIPGYRWDPEGRCWYVAALPLALDILADGFGTTLSVTSEAASYIDLKRIEEGGTGPLSLSLSEAATAMPAERLIKPTGAEPAAELRPTTAVGPPADVFARLTEQLERLTAAIERLDERLAGGGAPSGRATGAPAPARADPAEAEPGSVEEVLARLNEDAPAALDQANRALQASAGDWPDMRALAGIAAWRAGRADTAFEHLSRALHPRRNAPGATIATPARVAYEELVLSLINADTRPVRPIGSASDMRGLILLELQEGSGFDRAAFGSSGLRTLDQLVTEEGLAASLPDLAANCRVAQLVASARAGARRARAQVVDALRTGGLHPDGQALAAVLLANVLLNAETVSDWIMGWPREVAELGLEDASWVAERAMQFLPLVDRELAAPAALAVLAIVAPAPSEQVTLQHRRELARYASGGNGRYAQFLAFYAVALSGERASVDQFPGYLSVLAERSLESSAGYLADVYMAGTPDLNAEIAERAYLPSFEARGVHEPIREMIDLIPLVETSPRADNLLNRMGAMVEGDEVAGASRVTAAQRLHLFRAAFEAAVGRRHDQDAREAFWRLVRQYQLEPGNSAVRELCAECLAAEFRPLKAPALICQLETLLAEGADHHEAFANVGEAIRKARKGNQDLETLERAVIGLQFAYPQLRDDVQAALAGAGQEPELEAPPSFGGKRIVLAGGRPAVCKHVEAALREWRCDVVWLDAAAAKQGERALAAARGSADLVVVNTAYIGHAASARIRAEAEGAGKRPVLNDADGVGLMLSRIWKELTREAASPVALNARPRKVKGLRDRAGI